jgi:hypothetical protein
MISQIRFLALAAMTNLVTAQNSAAAKSNSTATGGGGGATTGAATAANAKVLNQDFYNYIFVILASLVVALTIWRVGIEGVKHVRTMTCINNERQTYFVTPSKRFASIKQHILYAPVLSKRHNKEIQLSSALNVGTLPTRFQLFFLMSYFGTNVAFCVVGIPWSGPLATVCQQLRNRTGILAVVNMVSQPLQGGWIT